MFTSCVEMAALLDLLPLHLVVPLLNRLACARCVGKSTLMLELVLLLLLVDHEGRRLLLLVLQ